MKKLLNAVIVIMLVILCCLSCACHISNKFFKEDIGTIAIQEVDLNRQLDDLFAQIENIVPQEDRQLFESLKLDIENNDKIKSIIGEASLGMIDDIANDHVENQNMTEVLSKMIYSYDEQLQKVFVPLVTKEQLHTYIDQAIQFVPVQKVYDDAVDTFQQKLPAPYLKMLKILSILSNKQTWMFAMIASLLCIAALIVINFQKFKWLFSLGIAFVISGLLLLAAGQIVPRIYVKMLAGLDQVLTQFSQSDFKMITYYGLGFLIVGAVGLIGYMFISKVEKINAK